MTKMKSSLEMNFRLISSGTIVTSSSHESSSSLGEKIKNEQDN